jgi:hypothetical protein
MKKIVATLFAAAVALPQIAGATGYHWVNPYTKSDGTSVQGHWRSNPNGTCLDNIRGCR